MAATVLGWHAVAAASFLAFAFSLSDDASPTCSGFCFSPRGGVAIMGMLLGCPALLVSLLVSTGWAVAFRRSARDVWAGVRLGTGSALVGLFAAGAVVVVIWIAWFG